MEISSYRQVLETAVKQSFKKHCELITENVSTNGQAILPSVTESIAVDVLELLTKELERAVEKTADEIKAISVSELSDAIKQAYEEMNADEADFEGYQKSGFFEAELKDVVRDKICEILET
jgi:hypothetical protein